MKSAGDFRLAGEARRNEINAEIAEVRQLQKRHEADRATVEQQRGEVLQRLAAALLPGLDAASFERAARVGGFVAGRQTDPIAAMQAEGVALQERIAAIEADDRYVRRELLAAPRTGELSQKIAELEEFRAPAADLVKRAELTPRFHHLVQVGYGTEAYNVPFWRLSYYRDWKAGDEALEQWPGQKASFAEVRADFEAAQRDLATFDASLAPLRREVADIAGLVDELGQRQQQLATLPERHLGSWRQKLTEHLATLDPAWLADRLGGEPDVELLFKQAQGLAKKLEYLDAVAAQSQQHVAALKEEDRGLMNELQKLARPKNYGRTYGDDVFQKRFVDRPARMRKVWQRTSRAYDTVYVFDRWDRGRFIDDFLWWDVMTDGRLDGNFIPDVMDFHSRHPDYAYDRHRSDDRDDDAAAAAATVAAVDHEPHGLLDAS